MDGCQAEKKKPGDAFLSKTTCREAAVPKSVLDTSTIVRVSPMHGPESVGDPGDAEKYESIVAPSDRRALRKVTLYAYTS